jgi:hypothetical protein
MFAAAPDFDYATRQPRIVKSDLQDAIAAHLAAMGIERRDRVLIEAALQGRAAIQFADRERVKAILAPVRDSIEGQRMLLDAVRAMVA